MIRYTHMQRLIVLCIASLGIALIDCTISTPALAQQPPALRIMPHCQDYWIWRKAPDEGIEVIDGFLTNEFFEAFKTRLSEFGIKPHPTEPRHFSVAWGHEPEPRVLVKVTILAVDSLIMQRHGLEAARDIQRRRAQLPAPDFHPFGAFPTCTAIRKIALKGGEWADRGPPLTYAK